VARCATYAASSVVAIRKSASQKAGLDSISAIVRTVSDEESCVLALIENLQREDLDPIEEARGFRLRYRLPAGGDIYDIEVRNPEGRAERVVAVAIDGRPGRVEQGAACIPLFRDGHVHQVRVTLAGAVRAVFPPSHEATAGEQASRQKARKLLNSCLVTWGSGLVTSEP
jgi:hypothetical protein